MARRLFWLSFLAVALAVGTGAYLYVPESSGPGNPAPAAKAANSNAERAVAVEVQPVSVNTVIEDIHAVGTLRPNESLFVAPEIAGRVERIRFNEGDTVDAGAVMVELDSSILRAEMAKAKSDLTLAKANYERASTLASQGNASLRTRDEGQAAFLAAQANLALAEARLQKATLTAPIAGVVGLRSVSAGAYVVPGEKIVELSDIETLKVDFRVPELRRAYLKPGQTIMITADAVPNESFEGTIYALDPTVDINGRAVRIRARIPNPDLRLSPGLFVRVQIIVERRSDAVLIAESAVFQEAGKSYAFRIVDGRAKRMEVAVGQRRPGVVEIRDGLEAHDVVVTAGHQRLRDGALVEVIRPGTGS
jgi:membrane fusion protein (multidrug efflux system)